MSASLKDLGSPGKPPEIFCTFILACAAVIRKQHPFGVSNAPLSFQREITVFAEQSKRTQKSGGTFRSSALVFHHFSVVSSSFSFASRSSTIW
jgi:hypothetical protein